MAVTSTQSWKQIVALSEEMASLIRAGVPLHIGMAGLNSAHPARFQRIAEQLASTMQRGNTLNQAIAIHRNQFPDAFLSVVDAGAKSGNLSIALESLAQFGQDLLEMRRRILLALIYPMVIMLVAYLIMIFYTLHVFPEFLNMYYEFGMELGLAGNMLEVFRDYFYYWVIGIPSVFLLVTLLFALIGFVRPFYAIVPWPVVWLPGLRGCLHTYEYALFARMLSIGMQQNSPLPEALQLASGVISYKRIKTNARKLADQLSRGATLADCLTGSRLFTPLFRWMLLSGGRHNTIAVNMQELATVYRNKALRKASYLSLIVPIVLILFWGFTVVLIYALLVFLPLLQLMNGLS